MGLDEAEEEEAVDIVAAFRARRRARASDIFQGVERVVGEFWKAKDEGGKGVVDGSLTALRCWTMGGREGRKRRSSTRARPFRFRFLPCFLLPTLIFDKTFFFPKLPQRVQVRSPLPLYSSSSRMNDSSLLQPDNTLPASSLPPLPPSLLPLPPLPMEIKRQILAFADTGTLALCSRVSLAFLEMASELLYKDVEIVGFERLEEFFCSRVRFFLRLRTCTAT